MPLATYCFRISLNSKDYLLNLACDAGKWGHSCHKSCDCDDCDRLNGKCGGGGDGDKKKGADKKGVSGSNSVHMKSKSVNYALIFVLVFWLK